MHDDGTVGGPMRQVKVDNWGIFFLQRLQQFFNRSDHCDLTLQFSGNVKIKVHRLVLNACTEYFQALEKKLGKTKDNVLSMPSDLSPDVVLPIINFMYTGRLEFRDSLTKKLYYTAGRLNMPVLTKLLDAQGASDVNTEASAPTYKSATPAILSKSQNNSFAKKNASKELPEMLPGRKLPIWKKRRTPFLMSSFDDPGPAESAALAPDNAITIKEEPARPTRFEWPEDEETLKSYVPPFDSITYESAPLQLHSQQPPKPQVEEKKTTFEELQSKYQPIKRLATSIPEPSPKKSKMDIQSVKEYLQEQEVRKQIVSNEEDNEECMGEDGMALGDIVEDDDDDEDERDAESILPDVDDSVADMSNVNEQEMSLTTPQTKSILKQRYTEEATPSKKVRFSLANQEQQFTNVEEYTTADLGEGSSDSQASPANHAKIISEVLKKYPHLVRDNKNIRLRIMKQGSCPSTEADAKNKKVSYVVLKAGDAGGKNRSPAKVIVKTGGRVEHISGLMATSQVTKPVSGAENTTGPWLCFSCGTNEDPINFETYYLYRRHLQDIHMEKIDARICEHCGHRASKRNLLLYHLYTKHNISPPRNCQFPKCDQCDYVALSESLLIKHRNNHSNARDFVCKVCNASFKSNGALQGHMQTNLHSDPDKKKYECPYCRKPFVRNINLKAHVRTAHKDIERKFEEEEPQETVVSETEAIDPKKKKRRDILLLRGKDHSTETENAANNAPSHSLEPSSEAEALSNVASGIAASLGLADQLAEVSEHQTVVQTMPAADGSVQTFIISAVPGQEYIVPEMLANSSTGEQYQIATASSLADLVQYDTSNLGAVVSSLAGASGQQTIVITSAPSGGQEHLKLIAADGTPLELLAGQNIIVTNPDGTTSTASAADGYQAILQANGVLTLQQVGTHVIQGDGETVTEETLQYHVAHPGHVLLSQDEVHKQVEDSMVMMTSEEVDTKPYTIVTSNEEQIEESHIVEESHVVEESQEQPEEHHEVNELTAVKTMKSRTIGTSIPIEHGTNKSELVSTSMQAQMAEIHHAHLEPEGTELSSEIPMEETVAMADEVQVQEMAIDSSDGQVMTVVEEVHEEDNSCLVPQEEVLSQLHEQEHTVTEESCEVEMEQQQIETDHEQMQLDMEEQHHHQQEQQIELEEELVQGSNEEVSHEIVQEEVFADNEILHGEEREILQDEVLVDNSQYHQDDSVDKQNEDELETMPLQVAEETDQVEEIETQEDGEGTMIIEEQGALMIEAEESTNPADEETEQGVILMSDEQVAQDIGTDEEQGALMIEAEPQPEEIAQQTADNAE